MQKNAPHIEDLLSKLYNLNRDRGSGWEKPYKPALLLALIDLMSRAIAPTTASLSPTHSSGATANTSPSLDARATTTRSTTPSGTSVVMAFG
ncbi:hypothetical protein SH580_10270 [Coraliomargarita algicola]|uniref:Uncharacterized protein n=1 Tax=Coraliomargarita algicola TaxID=3092156 RepID=A0ABZ0RPC6_9BACT|nr:hypothetical protein [Coraliomargarita sp. J2-16]WPJ98084.1 hypothetical protein SH580_10270 [Coraliomargarita sp. J2-16]